MKNVTGILMVIVAATGCQAPTNDTSGALSGSNQPTCNSSASPFGGGAGTSGNPNLICSVAQLNNVRLYPADSYLLASDIDSGQSGTPFTIEPLVLQGTFDGGGHKITRFYYNNLSQGTFPAGTNGDSALFKDNYGTIKNLVIASALVQTHWSSALLVVTNHAGALIQNVTLTSGHAAGNTSVGSVAAHNYGTIKNCTSAAQVDGDYLIGGLVGQAYSGSLTQDNTVTGIITWTHSGGHVFGYNVLGTSVNNH